MLGSWVWLFVAADCGEILVVLLEFVSGYAGGVAVSSVCRFGELILTLPVLLLRIRASAVAPPSATSVGIRTEAAVVVGTESSPMMVAS